MSKENQPYTKLRAYIELHISVLLWGFTGILGRLIEMDSFLLVFYRLLFTCLSLLLFRNLYKNVKQIPKPVIWYLLGIGGIAALHWVTFYGSIHMANVSVAVGMLALTSFFTSLLEPLLTKQKVQKHEVALGITVCFGLGVMFLYGKGFETGMFVGIISALLAALFTTLNKIVVDKYDPSSVAMTFVEMSGGWLLVSILIPFSSLFITRTSLLPSANDLHWLLLLALVCTTLPFILSLRALKKLTAFTSVLAINMEPIYSIFLAILIFQENKELNAWFYFGTAIVIIAIFTHPMLESFQERRRSF